MNIVFFGTPVFAAEILRYLLDHQVSVIAAVTQPDRPKGRSLQMTPSPVKSVALERKIPLFQPEKAKQEPFLQEIAAFHADLFVVVAFGQILPQKLLNIPRLGCINVHTSLLPKYRGAAPIQRCLMAGENETGVSIQKMAFQLDAGDIIAVSKMAIPQEMNFGELEQALLSLAKPLLLQVIHEYAKKIPTSHPQHHESATYASKIELDEGLIDWNRSAQEIHNLIRAFSPRPGAWCWIEGNDGKKKLKILRAQPVSGQGVPGTLLSQEGIVCCGKGALQMIDVQPEGRKIMKAADWLRGQKKALFSF